MQTSDLREKKKKGELDEILRENSLKNNKNNTNLFFFEIQTSDLKKKKGKGKLNEMVIWKFK